jgi:hypothetical protein
MDDMVPARRNLVREGMGTTRQTDEQTRARGPQIQVGALGDNQNNEKGTVIETAKDHNLDKTEPPHR